MRFKSASLVSTLLLRLTAGLMLLIPGCQTPCIRSSDCPAGQRCQVGQCVVPDGGTDGGADAGGADLAPADLTSQSVDLAASDLMMPADLREDLMSASSR